MDPVNAYFGVYIALPVNPEIIAIEVLGGGCGLGRGGRMGLVPL